MRNIISGLRALLRKEQVEPGVERLSVKLDARSFSFFDVKNTTGTPSQENFNILVGSSSAGIELQGKLTRQP